MVGEKRYHLHYRCQNFAKTAKAGAQTNMSIKAVDSVVKDKSRHTHVLEQFAKLATIAMHISQRARGIRAFIKMEIKRKKRIVNG